MPSAVTVNLNSSLFNVMYTNQGRVGDRRPDIGGVFTLGTEQARITAILQKSAHLVRGNDGNWLIPNDGPDLPNSGRASGDNTELIVNRCRDQINQAAQ